MTKLVEICKMVMYCNVIINKSGIIINAIDVMIQNKFYGIDCIKLDSRVLIAIYNEA